MRRFLGFGVFILFLLYFNFQGKAVAMIQNDQNNTDYSTRLEGQEVMQFEEEGITFFISRRGDLYFKYRKIYCCADDGRILSRSFKGKDIDRDYKGRVERIGKIPISHDYRGRINKIGKLSISYNYNNKIDQVGDVPIDYQIGRVREVGQTEVDYTYGKVSKICRSPFF
ncbi:hypothetical protein [Xanthovirga aplysinae]|uniref:hypothetical protein n=1 Tax=Xanthovirga aplysinae TaxID=2529853 RepID=UPI0012BB829D|nr:hypothetical protein [Xanthovirga aplysinae]MTI33087.1 hypothetical protein [Xanthovirga aplysinae]